MSIPNNSDGGRDVGPEPHAIPGWKLERYLLGELPADEMRALEARIGSDPACARSLEALRAELGSLDAAHPAAAMAEGIARRLARTERIAGFRPAPSPASARLSSLLRAPRAAWIPALGLLALLAVLPLSPWRSPDSAAPVAADSGPEETTRLKGLKGPEGHQGLQPGLLLHRRTADGPARLRSGEGARAGDLIQIQYESAGRPYGAILSLDAEGGVTRHLPDTGERSAPLAHGGPVALPFAYELDDAPGWERFWLITSDRPFAVAEAEAALRRLIPGVPPPDSLPLPAGLGQAAFTLHKDSGT